jgi:hypothetical protein
MYSVAIEAAAVLASASRLLASAYARNQGLVVGTRFSSAVRNSGEYPSAEPIAAIWSLVGETCPVSIWETADVLIVAR